MKQFMLFLIIIAISAEIAHAQTRKKSTQDEDRGTDRVEDFDERLSNTIEEFVNRITGEFDRYDDDEEFQDKKKKKKASEARTFDGNTTIEEGEEIDGDVVVKGGDLTIYGKVLGDVLVVGGTLYVKNGGVVEGNARVISGDIVREDGGVIRGYMDKTRTSEAASYREDRERFRKHSYTLNTTWIKETTNLDNFIFRFNRVEGLFLGLGSDKKYYWDGSRNYNAYGSIGYGFRSHRWRYNLGVTRQFAIPGGDEDDSANELLEFGVEGHSFTDTKDHWLITIHENTAAALLLHQDFRDYFGREGVTFHTAYTSQKDYLVLQGKVEYTLDRYTSLINRTEYAWFGGEKTFRPNPSIDEGKIRSIIGSIGLSTFSKTIRGPEGWSIHGSGEFAKSSFGSDFSFTQLVADLRRYQPLGRYDNINIRLRLGTSNGLLPVQRFFQVGGLGTLHGYRFKSVEGNRLLLANGEYIVNGDFLRDLDFWPSWLMRGINFLFMGDAGWINDVDPKKEWSEGFESFQFKQFKTSVGFGFANKSGSFRVAFSWRTDVKAPATFVLRFARPF